MNVHNISLTLSVFARILVLSLQFVWYLSTGISYAIKQAKVNLCGKSLLNLKLYLTKLSTGRFYFSDKKLSEKIRLSIFLKCCLFKIYIFSMITNKERQWRQQNMYNCICTIPLLPQYQFQKRLMIRLQILCSFKNFYPSRTSLLAMEFFLQA